MELNRAIVKRDLWASARFDDGAEIEIVTVRRRGLRINRTACSGIQASQAREDHVQLPVAQAAKLFQDEG